MNNYPPEVFGPAFWKTLHLTCASATTPEKLKAAKQLIYLYKVIIPCEKCRRHYIVNLQSFPPDLYMANNVYLFYWSWKMHDMVNEQTGKEQQKRWNLEKAAKAYGIDLTGHYVTSPNSETCGSDCEVDAQPKTLVKSATPEKTKIPDSSGRKNKFLPKDTGR